MPDKASTAADETVASYYTLIYIQQFQESMKFKVEGEYFNGQFTICFLLYNRIFWDMMGCCAAHFGQGVWKSPKLTKYGLKFCPEGFGVVDVFR